VQNKQWKKPQSYKDIGTWKKSTVIGTNTINARPNWARLKRTVATGKTSMGMATFLIRPPFSRIDPVDIMIDWAKKFQGKIADQQKIRKIYHSRLENMAKNKAIDQNQQQGIRERPQKPQYRISVFKL
jgi:hypothetical protein